MLTNDYDIIALTETWLNDTVFSAEFSSEDRLIFRKDRDRAITGKSQGGGVLIAIRNNYTVTELKLFNDEQEAIGVKVDLNNNYFLYIVLVYIVPNSPNSTYELFFEKMENLLIDKTNSELVILGDFNIPSYVNQLSCNENLNTLRAFLSFNNLSQFNQITNSNSVILDLVIASFDNVEVQKDSDPLIPIDNQHPCLSICLETKSTIEYCKYVPSARFNFKKADFGLMYSLFKTQKWDTLEACSDVDTAVDIFYSLLNEIFLKCVPKTIQVNKKYPVWFNKTIISLIKLKYNYFLKFKQYKSQYWKQKFNSLRNLIKHKIKISRAKYILDVQKSLRSDPKFFWSYIKGLKDSPDILEEMTYENQIFKGSQHISEGFAKFFKSVYINDDDPCCTTSAPRSHFCEKSLSIENIYNAIKKIKGNRAIGPDGVPAYIFKGCNNFVVKPLQFIFNLILRTSVYPQKWKTSKLIPIYKSGTRQDIKNYRPISIVCAVSKIFEVLVFDLLFDEISNKINSSQHGFLPRKSTFTNLASFCQFVHDAINNKSQVDVIYTDMEKAFDRVRHCYIVNSLTDMEVSSYLVNLIQSYLSFRFQYVEVKGSRSVIIKCTSGVPQGSNLGPLLFLAAINNIMNNLGKVKGLLFADDFKCFFQINSVEDCETLQRDFCSVSNWCEANGFNLNVRKCSCMSFTLNRNRITYNYKLNNSSLKRVDQQKDLGVIFDSSLSFTEHIVSKIESAQKISGFISRNTKEFDVNLSLYLFDSLVVPVLEYGSIIWSPQYNVWSTIIERVQRKFLKCLYYRLYGIYPERGCDNDHLLGVFGRLSLDKRRLKLCMCTMFRLLKNAIDSPELLAQLPFVVNRINSRNSNVFYLTCPRTNLYKNSPIYKMCHTYNLYAASIDIDLTNYKQFKKLIDEKLRAH